MQPTLMQQGVELMLYGMGTVFVFLTLLIVMTSVMSNILQRFVGQEVSKVTEKVTVQTTPANDDQLIAVISAAVHKYRSRHKK